MRTRIYNTLVNKHLGITYRYHKSHDGSTGVMKLFSWLYLLWLNFAYYFLFMRFLGKLPEVQPYESKRLPTKHSESQLYHRDCARKFPLSIEAYVEKLSKYEIISFDIFDTLIFRPFSLPTDLFRIVGEKLGILDFTNIRAWAEWDARLKCNEKNGHMEVTLADIYDNLEKDLGCSSKFGQDVEIEAELSLCYANPFMLEVWNRLLQMGKRIIVVSDMYLSSEVLARMLEQNGYKGYDKLYVSCEYGKNKAKGNLYRQVLSDFGLKKAKIAPYTIIHVGDNEHSDRNMAMANGIDNLLYPRIDKNAILYRPFDMSFIVGSAYRGLVTNHIYNGCNSFSMEYEYGYIYGGLFVTGYCSFIHDYCRQHDVDKILFLSRDGDILKQAYELLYPDDIKKTEYVYWSRKAATTLMANEDKHDYFRRFIYHKVNQEYSIAKILESMGLSKLTDELDDWYDIWLERTRHKEQEAKSLAYKKLQEDESIEKGSEKWNRMQKHLEKKFSNEKLEKNRKRDFIELKAETILTDRNAYLLRRFIEAKWDKVIDIYHTNQLAAKRYYGQVLYGASSAVAVDIGWAGSGAMALSHLTEKVWNIPCKITGIIAGTNTLHNQEPDASEPFLQSGKLVAYLYSQNHNRDLLKKHDLNKGYNIFWELLLSSPTPQFAGFYDGKLPATKTKKNYGGDVYLKESDITLRFGKYDDNLDGIKEVQSGILDFVKQYDEHFHKYPYMFNISGRDAYAPMLLAASHNEKYLKVIEKKFNLEINVT